jgi:16S rRNA C1402 (ribose-2'-O) methylase RsmI
MLSWLPDQTITDRICKEQFITSTSKEEMPGRRSSLKEIFKGKDQKSKDQVMYEAHLQYGYTLKEIAEYIGLHYTTVSRAIKKIEGEDEK